jgi:hypothetical protein
LNPFGPDAPRATSTAAEKQIKDQRKALKDAQDKAASAIDDAAPGKSVDLQAIRNYVDMQVLLTKQIRETAGALKDEEKAEKNDNFADHTGNIELYKGQLADLKRQRHDMQQQGVKDDQEARLATLEAQKSAAEKAKAAARKQFEEQMKSFEEQLAQRRRGSQLQIGEEYLFWERMQATTKVGSLAWLEINKRIGVERQQMLKALASDAKSDGAELRRAMEESAKGIAGMAKEAAKDRAEQADSSYQLNSVYQKNAGELRALNVEQQLQYGEITKYSAAQQLAAIRAQVYGAKLEELKAKIVALNNLQNATPEEKKQRDEAKNKLWELQGEIDLAAARTKIELNGLTLFGGVSDEIRGMIAKSLDAATQMREIFRSVLSTVNDQMANMMTGKKTDWRKAFGGVAQQGAHQVLQTGEGFLMKSLGLGGKVDGSSEGAALWVRMAAGKVGGALKNSGANIIDSVKSSFGGLLHGNLGGMGGFFKSFLGGLIPHASGGPVSAGVGYMVGEHGPEPFFPGTSGTMATNNALRGAMGAGGRGAYYNFAGANFGGVDATQIEARFSRMLRAVHGSAVKDASHAVREHHLRTAH